MEGMKIRLLKKFKSIPTIISLKQTVVSQLNISEKLSQKSESHPTATPGSFSPSKQIKDCDDEYYDASFYIDDKENHTPILNSKYPVQASDDSSLEDDISFLQTRDRPDEVSLTLNCPNLSNYEAKCPPGGEDRVILYTTSLRGIRKTSEDCKTVRFLLKSFKLVFYTRDVLMDLEYRDELWNVMGGRVVPPRLFIKGRYIGGADEVITLHEQGNLRKLLHGIPVDPSSDEHCRDCAGVGFVVCLSCKGSGKVFSDNDNNDVDGDLFVKCTHCNENGLVKCGNCY